MDSLWKKSLILPQVQSLSGDYTMTAPRQFKSELVAVFGQPVAENPTQCMVEAAFHDLGIDWRYLTIEVAPADLADAIRGMRAMGFLRGNCTNPHHVAVDPYLA